MVKHIVCMKFRHSEDAVTAREKLLALMGKVPSLRSMEVGLDFMHSARAYDLVLISTYDDRAGLDAYTNHPEHKKVQEYIHGVREGVVSVDFEF